MSWSLTIGRFGATTVRVHLTFFLLLAWIGVSAWEKGGLPAARDSVLFIALIFTCVVLHEFGHIIMARRFGIETPDVILLPIGGVARMPRMPQKPAQELAVAIAGPMVNVAIAFLLFLVLGTIQPDDLTRIEDPRVSFLARLAAANVFLVIFNMIPAFPMDGGRVLHAVLAMKLGGARATQIAGAIGQALAFALGFLGLFGNPLLIFIAIFVIWRPRERRGCLLLTRWRAGFRWATPWKPASMRSRLKRTWPRRSTRSRALRSGSTAAASSGRASVSSTARMRNTFILARPMTRPRFLSSPRIWFSRFRLILTSKARLTRRALIT